MHSQLQLTFESGPIGIQIRVPLTQKTQHKLVPFDQNFAHLNKIWQNKLKSVKYSNMLMEKGGTLHSGYVKFNYEIIRIEFGT